MARKTKEEAQATRCQLLDAAQRVFCERGVSHTSLHEIAAEAGLTRGAVYWHFENKAALLAALWERVSLPIDALVEEMEQKYADDPLGGIENKMLAVLRLISENQEAQAITSIVLTKCEYVEENEAVREHFVAMREQCLDEVEAKFGAAVAKGQLPAGTPARMAALGLFAIFDGACFHWLMDPGRYPLMAHAELMVRAYLRGLRCA